MTARKNLLTPALALIASAFTLAFAQSSVPPEFDVASVKLDPAADGPPGMTVEHNGHMAAHRMSLEMLISAAYDVEDYQITRGTDWVRTERYDVSAVAPPRLPTDSFDWWRPLLRSLLADRFRLVLRRETKQMSVFNLIVAKNGIRVRPAMDGNCAAADPQNPPQSRPGEPPPRLCNNLHYSRSALDATGITMQRFAYTLAAMLHQPVMNRTGFTGLFDVHLDYAPIDITGGPADSASASSIFTVLQDQMELRLEPAKGPAEVLVIDHVERPTPN